MLDHLQVARIAAFVGCSDGAMVGLTDDDFAALPVPTLKAVEVLSFVPADQIAPLLLDKAYYAAPPPEPKPYVLLRDPLPQTAQVRGVDTDLRQREPQAT